MSSHKRSKTYWSTNTFAPSVAICIARIICHRISAAICIGRPICLCSSAAICIGQVICHPESAAICIDYTNMLPSSIWFTIHIENHIVLSNVWIFYSVVTRGVYIYMCVCVCVFIKSHITAQPGPVELIFQCYYSNGSALWGISVCVCVCVCVFNLNCT